MTPRVHRTPEKATLGEFEQLVLLAILHTKQSPYAVPIRDAIEARTRRTIARGALYTALERLEAKGFVTSRLGASTPTRGGRPKRFFKLTATGVRALRTSRDALASMWRGLESVLGTLQ